jgi:hypothetical protein
MHQRDEGEGSCGSANGNNTWHKILPIYVGQTWAAAMYCGTVKWLGRNVGTHDSLNTTDTL